MAENPGVLQRAEALGESGHYLRVLNRAFE